MKSGDPVEVLCVWASGGPTGQNQTAWFGGYEYVRPGRVRIVRGTLAGCEINEDPANIRPEEQP